MKIVILVGGGGSRLWPISRESKPKQLCRLLSDKTMLEETIDRFKSYPKKDIYISTTSILEEEIRKILPDVPEENFIVEPEKRDTGPAMGYVAAYLYKTSPDEPIAFIPSDHYIARPEKLLRSIEEADKMIRETGKLLDISVYPTSPTTTLGYTKIGKMIKETDGVEFYEFLEHKEKPDFETAKRYLEDGSYLWHANYYMWTPRKFLEAYEKYAPEIYENLAKIIDLFGQEKDKEKIKELFSAMPKISIDYAVTEKMDPEQIMIIRGDFGWSDIGAWDTLYENMLASTDDKKNLVRARHIGIDTTGCVIYGPEKKIIATLGVDDLVVIDTPDALLVCPKSRAQEIKKTIEVLKEEGKEYL